MQGDRCVGTVVCKLAKHKSGSYRGYIAMLAVDQQVRKRRIGTSLVRRAITAMIADNADEVVLETEVTNTGAISLYEKLGFARDKMLYVGCALVPPPPPFLHTHTHTH
jgi:peptide alpha-N-acetyltransferase